MTNFSQHCPKEECGIIGIYDQNNLDTASMAYFGMIALQHRGQEGAGIAVGNGGFITMYKDSGSVQDIFDQRILSILRGDTCLGHVKYGSAGGANSVQPVMVSYKKGNITVALNGALLNSEQLRREWNLESTEDAALIGELIAKNYENSMSEAIEKTIGLIKGGFALGILADDKLFGARDEHGIRPLSLGKLPHGFVLASETVALDILGAEFVSNIEPGQIVSINYNGIKYNNKNVRPKSYVCGFEFVYFARPDSTLDGMSVYQARENAGIQLAKEYPVAADCVIGVPDSGTPAAIGYSKGSGIPYCMGLIKNRYIGRTFIQPTQKIRELSVKLKLNAVKENVKGKRVVLVDDSIVRGTTCVRIIEHLRRAGATEVHMMVSSPPVTELCLYGGIDIFNRDELISNRHTKEEICKLIGADSLGFLSREGLASAVDGASGCCMGCVGGVYPGIHD